MTPLAGLIAALALLEGMVRGLRRARSLTWTSAPPRLLSFLSHPYALYVRRPNCDGLYPSNSLGYAGKREYPPACLPGTIRIYCVGGSTTEAHDPAQGPDASWPGKLQDLLAQRFPGTAFECINAGTAGYTSAESLAEFAFRGVDLKPDLLVVYHNVNDAWTCQMVEGFRSDYSHARRHKPWDVGWINRLPPIPWWAGYELLRGWIMRRWGKANALIYWIADPPWRSARSFQPQAVAAFERNIRNLIALATTWDCVPVLIKWECDWAARRVPNYLEPHPETAEVYFRYLQANNEALARLGAAVPGCHYLDVGPFDPEHFSDTIHFSPQGLEEMARRVADGLLPVVQSLMVSAGGR
ncbi:MAG: SGNH/GDSL hydrolase family protein [Candidatus Omnitrophica bacterium]|nr:SGNH/GDSL hydrolase family protein [Candidatus Omnitrophota bacterium]